MDIQTLQSQSVPSFSIKIVYLLGKAYLLVPDQSKIRHVLIRDIVRLEGVRNYTIIHLKNGSTMISSRTLKIYESVLLEANFLRVHRAHLINLQCMSKYDECSWLATMQNEDIVTISRRKRKDFQSRIALI
jgi:two-component system, LytTR family, response regulator